MKTTHIAKKKPVPPAPLRYSGTQTHREEEILRLGIKTGLATAFHAIKAVDAVSDALVDGAMKGFRKERFRG